MGNGWDDWFKILIFLVVFIGPVLRWIYQLVVPDRQQPPPRQRPAGGGQGGGQGGARRRGIHEVLDEIRREMDGETERPMADGPVATGRSMSPRPVVRRAEPPERPARTPPRVAPEQIRATDPFVAAAPAVAEGQEQVQLSLPLDEIRHLESGSLPSDPLARAILLERARAQREPTLFGMNLRQVILAQTILGPPRVLQMMRSRPPPPKPAEG